MNNVEILDDYKKLLKETFPRIELDQRDELLLGMAINHTCLILKDEKELPIIKRENFIRSYPGTSEALSKNEIEYVLSNLDQADYEADVEHADCDIYCICPEEDLDDIEVMKFDFPLPSFSDEHDNERTINMLLCKRCHQWVISV